MSRETDARVARALGWRLVPSQVVGHAGGYSLWVDGDGKETGYAEGDYDYPSFEPSEDIAAAWELVEKEGLAVGRADDGRWFCVQSDLQQGVEYWFSEPHPEITELKGEGVYADTACEAICAAFLKAKGES